MKKICYLIFLIQTFTFSFHSSAQGKPLTTLKVGVVNYPPYFEFNNASEISGTGVEKIRTLLGPEVKIRWLEVPLGRGELALTKGHIDLYLAYTNDTSKYPNLSFADTPYLSLQPQLCGKELTALSETFSELEGKMIISPSASQMIDRVKGLKGVLMKVDYGDDYISKCLKLIKLGRAQYFFSPTSHFVAKFIKDHPDYNCVSIGPSYDAYIAVSKTGPHLMRLKNLPLHQSKNTQQVK